MSDDEKVKLDLRIFPEENGVGVQAFHENKAVSPRFSATYETLADRDLESPTGDARQILHELTRLASQYVAGEFIRRSFEA